MTSQRLALLELLGGNRKRLDETYEKLAALRAQRAALHEELQAVHAECQWLHVAECHKETVNRLLAEEDSLRLAGQTLLRERIQLINELQHLRRERQVLLLEHESLVKQALDLRS